jgi:signal recognition particle subunit SRP54
LTYGKGSLINTFKFASLISSSPSAGVAHGQEFLLVKYMFANLSERLIGIFDRLRGRGTLSEEDINTAMRAIRVALLEADVALPVVKEFIQAVKEKAIGQEVLQSITPGQMVVKIVHDHLVDVLGSEAQALHLNVAPPAVILMMGLQGSGKTTTTAKIAHFLQEKRRKKVLMASTDIYRPAAQRQLEVLGQQAKIDTLPIIADEKPLEIVQRGHELARLGGYDVLFVDTAGRLHIDEDLMAELQQIKHLLSPVECLLVADAMTGQDAVNIARTFHEQIGVTGIVLTRVDGDARGGAALSMRHITGCPIKFVGVGERLHEIEEFNPRRIVDRLLGMGDVVALVEKAAEAMDHAEAAKLAQKMSTGHFDLNDFATQLQQIAKLGGLSGLLGMLPGFGKIKNHIQEAGFSDKMIAHQLAIIRSMTAKERSQPKLLNASRRRRIATGSGRPISEVNRLLKHYQDMAQTMKRMTKLGEKGLRRQGLAALFSKHKG